MDATHILCNENISFHQLEEADRLLLNFVDNFESFYGESNAVFNVHCVRHLTDCVRFNGPLHLYSNYCFEDHIGHLVSLKKGTTDVATQICRKYLLEKNLFHLLSGRSIAMKFFEEIDSKNKYSISRKVSDSVVIGNARKSELTEQERSLIITTLDVENDTQIDEYRSVLLKGKVFYEIGSCINKRTNDSFILNMESNQFAEIKSIFVIQEKLYFLIKEKYDIVHDQRNYFKFIIDLKESNTPIQKVINWEKIGPKFALIQFGNTITCSKFPNMLERN